MQQATQATQPTMVIVENGHAYLVPDRQMANGKMMSDDMSDTSNPNVAADTQSQERSRRERRSNKVAGPLDQAC